MEWVTLNRPDVANALNGEMVDALTDYFEGLRNREGVRIIVLGASGRHFSAGADLSGDAFADAHRTPRNVWTLQRRIARVYLAMRRCPQPIIALVQGAACGGGFSLVLAADIRIAGESARMNAAYIKIGLTGCDMGSSYFLPRLVGTSVASELLLTGRYIHAPRALAVNLVSAVVPDHELASAARPTSPICWRLHPWDYASPRTPEFQRGCVGLEAAMAVEDRQQSLLALTEDAVEAGMAFLPKREPKYRDR
ncbi:MAG: enoyl-CoA hydratase/isomerase family protein [Halioglobus sp.]